LPSNKIGTILDTETAKQPIHKTCLAS